MATVRLSSRARYLAPRPAPAPYAVMLQPTVVHHRHGGSVAGAEQQQQAAPGAGLAGVLVLAPVAVHHGPAHHVRYDADTGIAVPAAAPDHEREPMVRRLLPGRHVHVHAAHARGVAAGQFLKETLQGIQAERHVDDPRHIVVVQKQHRPSSCLTADGYFPPSPGEVYSADASSAPMRRRAHEDVERRTLMPLYEFQCRVAATSSRTSSWARRTLLVVLRQPAARTASLGVRGQQRRKRSDAGPARAEAAATPGARGPAPWTDARNASSLRPRLKAAWQDRERR